MTNFLILCGAAAAFAGVLRWIAKRPVLTPDDDELGVQPMWNAGRAAAYLGIYEVTLIELFNDQRIGADGMTTSGPLFRRSSLNEWKGIKENRLILHAYASQTDARIMQTEFGPTRPTGYKPGHEVMYANGNGETYFIVKDAHHDDVLIHGDFGPIGKQEIDTRWVKFHDIKPYTVWFVHSDPAQRWRALQEGINLYNEIGVEVPEVWHTEFSGLTHYLEMASAKSTVTRNATPLLTTMVPPSTVTEWGGFVVILLVLLWLSIRDYDRGGGTFLRLGGIVNVFWWIITIAFLFIWGGIFWWGR